MRIISQDGIEIGQKFGMLTVIGNAEPLITKNGYRYKRFLCKCDCGKEKVITKRALTIDKTKSCGCLRSEILIHKTHGMTNTRLYRIWSGMKDRCMNPNSKYKKRYHDRGITICQEWGEELGIKDGTIRARLNLGWSVEDALSVFPADEDVEV